MSYLDALKQTTNQAITENGALANKSTLNLVLDFFSLAGAMRGNDGVIHLFNKAFAEDPKMAVRALFYLRDIRGGQGERDTFRTILKSLDKETQAKVIKYIPEYGRWDDLLVLEAEIIKNMITIQLAQDTKDMEAGKTVSLLAKWLPSENTSSEETKKRAVALMKAMGMKAPAYRKHITKLRKYIKLLEQKMSANQWPEIDYEKIPSQAHRKHVKAFHKHDEDRYSKYLEDVTNGEKKINTSTLYTYEVFDMISRGNTDTANVMWENLPDYTNGTNAIVLADVSGSMSGRPMSVSVSLALYFADRNQGKFNGYFMTFTEQPRLVKVLGNDLASRLANIENREWGYNTNIDLAFKAILDAAVKEGATQEDMPKVLYIISDMQFDQCTGNPSASNFEHAKATFEAAGYVLPHVVFWNVDARNEQAPATLYDNAVTLISGFSQSTFRYAVEGKTPLELMDSVLNSERYSTIDI